MAVKTHIIHFSLVTFLNYKKSYSIFSICPQKEVEGEHELIQLVIPQDTNAFCFGHLRKFIWNSF